VSGKLELPPTNCSGLIRALRRLDSLLQQALSQADDIYGREQASDPFRGLHVSSHEVNQLLAREPGIPLLWRGRRDNTSAEPCIGADDSLLTWLMPASGLSPFDLDVLIVALAPEVDLRYERIYAYLQNDVTRRRPTVDLALNLLCSSVDEKLARRAHFAADSPIIRHCLIHLIPDPNQLRPPLLAHYIEVDDQIIRLLLNQRGLDRRLAPYCQLITSRTKTAISLLLMKLSVRCQC